MLALFLEGTADTSYLSGKGIHELTVFTLSSVPGIYYFQPACLAKSTLGVFLPGIELIAKHSCGFCVVCIVAGIRITLGRHPAELERFLVLEEHFLHGKRTALTFNYPVKHIVVGCEVEITTLPCCYNRELTLINDDVFKLGTLQRIQSVMVLVVIIACFRLVDSIFLHKTLSFPKR